MSGEKNLEVLLQSMKPKFNTGEYVFCVVQNAHDVPLENVLLLFRESEGITLVLKKEVADALQLHYDFVAAWISLTVHSALEAVGLTAAFSGALAQDGISCNVVAAFYHDHIFVKYQDATKAMEILNQFSN